MSNPSFTPQEQANFAMMQQLLANQQQQFVKPSESKTIDQTPFLLTPKVLISIIASLVAASVYGALTVENMKRDISDLKSTPAKVVNLENVQAGLKNQVDTINNNLKQIQDQQSNFSMKLETYSSNTSTQLNNLNNMLAQLTTDVRSIKQPGK